MSQYEFHNQVAFPPTSQNVKSTIFFWIITLQTLIRYKLKLNYNVGIYFFHLTLQFSSCGLRQTFGLGLEKMIVLQLEGGQSVGFFFLCQLGVCTKRKLLLIASQLILSIPKGKWSIGHKWNGYGLSSHLCHCLVRTHWAIY